VITLAGIIRFELVMLSAFKFEFFVVFGLRLIDSRSLAQTLREFSRLLFSF
jgi:hypothetical protein